MCGISGILETSERLSPVALGEIAEKMAAELQHRGPNDSGVWKAPEGRVALSHRRLSVIDLSHAGHQPMTSANGQWTMVYNGELYNTEKLRSETGLSLRSFRGHSDTEVLLEAIAKWGVRETMCRANGMIALAAWNNRDKELWLARDKFGEKPLYYSQDKSRFIFGSELKALRIVDSFDSEIDRNSLSQLLEWAYIPGPSTIYQNTKKLLPGHTLRVSISGSTNFPEPYWKPEDEIPTSEISTYRDEDAIDQLQELLSQAVKSRLVADVPIGAFLSGGIDSSTVVALMQQVSTETAQTFTIGFTEPSYDESKAASAVAKHLETNHTEVIVSPEDARQVIPLLPKIYDEPFADSSQIPTFLLSQLARRNVTVALSGDGGDELFGGYIRYLYLERFEKIRARLPYGARKLVSSILLNIPIDLWDKAGKSFAGRLSPPITRNRTGHKLQKFARALGSENSRDIYRILMSTDLESHLMLNSPNNISSLNNHYENNQYEITGFNQARLSDTKRYLPDDLLTKVDRASMAVGLEVRVPMLDPSLLRFAWSLDQKDLVHKGQGKWVLRKLLNRFVPSELVERPKMGFGVPVGQWIREPLNHWASELLDPSLLSEQEYFNPEEVTKRWEQHLSGHSDWTSQLWSVLMFQAWLTESL